MSDRRKVRGSRVTPGAQISGARRMALPSLDGSQPVAPAAADRRRRDEPRRNAEMRDVFDKGMQAGLEQGRQQGMAEARRQFEEQAHTEAERLGGDTAARMAAVLSQFEASFAALEGELADKVLDLGILVAGKVLARELQSDRQALHGIVQQCLAMLGSSSHEVVVRLHPADLELIGQTISEQAGEGALQLQADDTLTPGGCLLETPVTVVDGTLETRWRRALAAFGTAADLPPELSA